MRFEFFWALALEKTQIRHDLTPLLSLILCGSLLFVDYLFSVCFQERLCISFSHCSSLDNRLYTYVFSCSLSRSFRRILLILVSSLTFLRFFSTRFTSFTSCFFRSRGLFLFIPFSLKTPSPQTWIITIFSRWQSFSSAGIVCELIKNCKILRITVQLQPHQFDFALKTRVANYLLKRLHIYLPTWSPRAMPNGMPAVRYTEARYSNMRTSLSSSGISWRTLMGYPSYARNHACALPSPSPFHHVMAKIVPVVQLAAHAKSSTLCGRSYGRTVVRS